MKTKKYNLGTKGVGKYPDGVFKKAVDYKELPVQGNYSVPEDKPIIQTRRDAKGSPVHDNFELDYAKFLQNYNVNQFDDTLSPELSKKPLNNKKEALSQLSSEYNPLYIKNQDNDAFLKYMPKKDYYNKNTDYNDRLLKLQKTSYFSQSNEQRLRDLDNAKRYLVNKPRDENKEIDELLLKQKKEKEEIDFNNEELEQMNNYYKRDVLELKENIKKDNERLKMTKDSIPKLSYIAPQLNSNETIIQDTIYPNGKFPKNPKKYNLGVQKVDVSPGSQGNEKFLYGNQYGQMGAGLGGTVGSGIGMAVGGPMGAQVGKLAGTALGYGAGYLIGNQKGKQIATEMDTQRGNELNINRSIDYQNDNFSGKDMYQDKKMFENTGYLDNKQLYAKYGLKNAPKEKIEVEKDEMIFRKDPKNGRTMLVADFKGGQPHSKGGEDFLAQDGDVIYPGKMRDQIKSLVGQDGYVTDEETFEAYRQQLPEDNESQEMAMGTGGYLGLANDIMNTGSQLMNFNKNIKAMDKQMLSGQPQMPQQENKAMGSILGAGQSLLGMLGNKQGGAVPIPEYKYGTRKFKEGDPDFTFKKAEGYQELPVNGPYGFEYKVQPKDTMTGIADTFKFGREKMMKLNPTGSYTSTRERQKLPNETAGLSGQNLIYPNEYLKVQDNRLMKKNLTPSNISESQGNELGYKGQDTGLGTQLDSPENMVAAFQQNNPITPFNPNYKGDNQNIFAGGSSLGPGSTGGNFEYNPNSNDKPFDFDTAIANNPQENNNLNDFKNVKNGVITNPDLIMPSQPLNAASKVASNTSATTTPATTPDSKSSFLNMIPNIIGTGANMLYAHGLTKERSEKRDATRVQLEQMKYQDRSNPQRYQNLLGSKLAMKNATNYAGGSINNLLGASAMSNAAYQQQANQIEQGESGVAMGIDQQNVGIKNQQNILNGQYFDQNKTANEMNDAKTRDIQRQGRLGMATTVNQSIQNAQTLQKDNLMQKESDRRYGLQEKLYGNQLNAANEKNFYDSVSQYSQVKAIMDKDANLRTPEDKALLESWKLQLEQRNKKGNYGLNFNNNGK